MEHEWVPQHEVRFGGAEGALTVLLGEGPVGVLVSEEARIECGPLEGTVRGCFDFDAAAVKQSLVALLARPDLTGHVHLTGSEHGEFRATLDLDHGRGVLTAGFESGYGMQDGGGTLTLMTDQSSLPEALRALDRTLAAR